MRARDPDKIARRAEAFQRVRRAHQLEQIEDYVELIGDLIEEHGEARATDLAQALGLLPGSVNKMLHRLQREGFIETEPYRALFLTDKGRELAAQSRQRHQLVEAFFVHVGVPPEAARLDAEGIEHHVSEETLGVFQQILSTFPPFEVNVDQRKAAEAVKPASSHGVKQG